MNFETFYREWKPRIDFEARRLGLDIDDVHLEVIPERVMREIASYNTLRRFSHPRFGGLYIDQQIHQRLGYSKIYENVELAHPPVIRFLDQNTLVDNIVVYAHSLGHVHLLRRNQRARSLPEGLVDGIGYHDRQVRRLEDRHGRRNVEEVIFRALSILFHVDWSRFDRSVNEDGLSFPERDLVWFLSRYCCDGPQEPLIRDVLTLLRREAFYFGVILHVKWLHEGFSCYVQDCILRNILDFPVKLFGECWAFHRNIVSADGGVDERGRRRPSRILSPYVYAHRLFLQIREEWDRYHDVWRDLRGRLARGDMHPQVVEFRKTLERKADVFLDGQGAIIATARSGHEQVLHVAETTASDVVLLREHTSQAFLDRHKIFAWQTGCGRHLLTPQENCRMCQNNAVKRCDRAYVLPFILRLVRNGGIYDIEIHGIREKDGALVLHHRWDPSFYGLELEKRWVEPALRDIAKLFGGDRRVLLHCRTMWGQRMFYKWTPHEGFEEHRPKAKGPPSF